MELLEREQHLAQLEEHLRQAAAGHGRLVLIGGEAGVGKTSLVEAFCRRVAKSAAVLRTSYDSLSTPGPLGALRDLAPALGLLIDQQFVDGGDRESALPEKPSLPSPRDRARQLSSAKMPTGPTAPRSSCCGSSVDGSMGCALSSS